MEVTYCTVTLPYSSRSFALLSGHHSPVLRAIVCTQPQTLTNIFVSSVRSSYSHPDLLLIHHPPHPTFSVTHRSSILDFNFRSHYSYIKAIML